MAVHGVESLETVASDAEHDGILGGNLARSNQLLRHAHGHAASRLREDAFGFGEELDRLANLIVGHVFSRAVGFFHHLERVEAIRGCADGK